MNRLLVLTVCLLITGCSTPQGESSSRLRESPGANWIRTELFFGLSKPDGSLIAAESWKEFLDDRIVRRFPEGLTVIDASGRYLDRQQRPIEEPSKLVILFYPPERAATAYSNISVIVTEYCSQFHQESVLRADSVSKTSFLPLKPAEAPATKESGN